MIEARASSAAQSLTRRLTAKAAAIGRSHAESRLRSTAAHGTQWRKARLLWPLFEGTF